MNKRLFSIALSIGVFMALAVATASAQKLGGYKEVSASDAAVRAAAEFAVSAQAEKSAKEVSLVDVIKAERQVVAGSNYRMCLKVTTQGEEGEADVTHFVQAIVYVDLKGNRKLSSWAISDCGEEDED
ncbi:MAG: cystatin domain-containing protein [Pyrinomonadaceae bacterium]